LAKAFLSFVLHTAKDSVPTRAGDLAGCLRGGPADLSTNPKHPKGYGG
jgi:hypothetical protein